MMGCAKHAAERLKRSSEWGLHLPDDVSSAIDAYVGAVESGDDECIALRAYLVEDRLKVYDAEYGTKLWKHYFQSDGKD